tara:strand:- start:790 stop:1257 length:468 start_codon:yes stop_codon:yes gene_type:complete
MSPKGLASVLKALKKSGSVFGVLLSKGHDTVISDVPYGPESVEELSGILDDISYYFAQEKRNPDQLAFSYDGGNLVILFKGDYRLVVLHHNSGEADFISKSATVFLRDYVTGEAVRSFKATSRPSASVVENQGTEGVVPARTRTVAPTAPIAPSV